MRRLLVGAAVLVLLGGCGSDGSDDVTADDPPAVTSDDLDGNTYVSTDLDGHDLVAGTTLSLTFADGTLGAVAGCNSMSATYELDGSTLKWSGEPASTLMACSDELTAQDRWVNKLLTDGVTVSIDGPTLQLENDDVNIVLKPE